MQIPRRGRAVSGRRYYDPSNGRFLGRDPKMEAGGLNLYGFCRNNGVNRWDYLGMSDAPAGYNYQVVGYNSDGRALYEVLENYNGTRVAAFTEGDSSSWIDYGGGQWAMPTGNWGDDIDAFNTVIDNLEAQGQQVWNNRTTTTNVLGQVDPNSLRFDYSLGPPISALLGATTTTTGGSSQGAGIWNRLGNGLAGMLSGGTAGATTGGAAGYLFGDSPGNAALGAIGGAIAGGATGLVRGLLAPPSTPTATVVNGAAFDGYVAGALGGLGAVASAARTTNVAVTQASTWDTSATLAGSRYTNVATNVSAQTFGANLVSNGFQMTTRASGAMVFTNGGQTTYTIYTATSTGGPSAQAFNHTLGQIVIKYRLGLGP